MNKIIILISVLFLFGCANCNTFIPKEELNHYYLSGALRGAECLKRHKPDDKIGTFYECVQNHFYENYIYYVEFHQNTCKYKMFE